MDGILNKILIFGGSGSLGTEIIKYYNDKEIIIFSRDEAKHWKLKNKFKNIKCIIGDVRDFTKVYSTLNNENCDSIIIAHALKQVDTCEIYPDESIKTNILGVNNIINSINQIINKPKNVCFISTDKACNPINVYGMCKSISEKIILNQSNNINWSIVRYGNVLTSTGSIIPLLIEKSKNKEPYILTHTDMTRFVMFLNEAVEIIDFALKNQNYNNIIIPKLKSMKILDLIEIFKDLFGNKIILGSIRPGEKIDESLISILESKNVYELNKYFLINKNYNSNFEGEYSSRYNLLSKEELKIIVLKLLKENGF